MRILSGLHVQEEVLYESEKKTEMRICPGSANLSEWDVVRIHTWAFIEVADLRLVDFPFARKTLGVGRRTRTDPCARLCAFTT